MRILILVCSLLAPVYTGETTGSKESVRWVPRKELSESDFAKQESGGNDFADPIYIARTNYSGGVLPGKQWRNQSCMYFCCGGKERLVEMEYELLLFPHGSLTWVKVTNTTSLPENRFAGGIDPLTGRVLYICRASLNDNQLVIGHLLVDLENGKSICKVPWGWNEWHKDKYEVLVDSRTTASGEGGSHNVAWQIGFSFSMSAYLQ